MDQQTIPLDRRALLRGAATSLSASLTASLTTSLAAPPARANEGARVIEARAGWLELHPGKPTAFEGFDGRSPGPLLRLRKGDPLDVTLVNALLAPTSIHWRGVRAPNAFDGVAPLTQKPVEPGARQSIRFVPPDAGTYFYHAHAEADMAAQVERGLYGALIVEEPDAPHVDHDLLAMLDDWRLDEAGAITPCGAIDVLTVNSVPAPMTQEAAPRARLRLRLVNAAAARIMAVRFEGAQALCVAIDGQPCRAFPPLRDTLPIGPGARFDVILDLPAQEGESARVVLAGRGGAPDRPLVLLTARGAAVEPRPPVEAAAENPLLPAEIRLQAAVRLDIGLEGPAGAPPNPASPGLPCRAPTGAWRLAPAKPVRPGDPLFAVKRGTPVTLGFVNRTGVAQVIRVHGHAMRQLHQLDDGWEPYWRDSVIVAPERTVRVAFVADTPGRWRIGSGIMDHAAGGMAGYFEVG